MLRIKKWFVRKKLRRLYRRVYKTSAVSRYENDLSQEIKMFANESKKSMNTLIEIAIDPKKYNPWGSYHYPSDSVAAIEVLGESGNAKAVDPLIGLYKNRFRKPEVIIEALGKIKEEKVIKFLLELFEKEDTDIYIIIRIIKALGNLEAEEALPLLIEYEKRVKEITSKWKSSHLTAIYSALGKIGNPTSIYTLLDHGGGSEEGEAARNALKLIIKKVKEQNNIDPILSLLRTCDNKYIMAGIAEVLGEIGNNQAIEPLIAMLFNPVFWERASWKENITIKKIANALNKLGVPLGALMMDVMKSDESEVEIFKQDKFAELMPYKKRFQRLIIDFISSPWEHDTKDDPRRKEINLLRKLDWKPSSLEEKVFFLIVNENWDQIIELGDKKCIDVLEKFFVDTNENIRKGVAKCIVHVGEKSNYDLKNLCLKYLKSENSHERQSVTWMLATMKDTDKIPIFLQLLSDGAYGVCDPGFFQSISQAFLDHLVGAINHIDDFFDDFSKKFYIIDLIVNKIIWSGIKLPPKDMLRAITIILEGLFKSRINSYSGKEDFERIFLSAGFSQEFFDLLWRASLFGVWNNDVNWSYVMKQCIEATKKLCEINTPLVNNILNLIANREDTSYMSASVSDDSYGYLPSPSTVERGSLEEQRLSARQELQRRGNPSYDPRFNMGDNEKGSDPKLTG